MRHGRVLLLSVLLITIVSSINIVDARRSPAAKKKTATLTPELFLDGDQDFGIEVRINDYGAGLGGPLAASSWNPPESKGREETKRRNEAKMAAEKSQLLAKPTNARLKEIPEDNKELLKEIGKTDGLELTYDKTINKFYYVITTQGKTDDQIKETIRLVNEVLSTH